MHLIDVDALIDIFEDRLEKIRNRYGDYSGEAGVCAGALRLIRVQPTIEPERKTGRWMWSSDEYGESWICSECMAEYSDFEGFKDEAKYCPNCGADMRGEQDETD